MTANLAYRVTVDGMTCITFAPSAKKARWKAIASALDAGFYGHRNRRFPKSVRAERVPELDSAKEAIGAQARCFCEEYFANR